MSYTTWHNYGFGICVDDIKTQNVARLETMLKLAPKLDRAIHEWLKGNSVNKPIRTLGLGLLPFCRGQ